MTSCLSVLGTRIQMGPASAPIVSDLVSTGYAHLTYYEHGKLKGTSDRAAFAFLPDPVCARIAMCLMDESWTFDGHGTNQASAQHSFPIGGVSKRKIAEMMGTIFSQGVCVPARGDFGEVAAALYVLFCGDVLRKQRDDRYTAFAVSYIAWMNILQNQGDVQKVNRTKDRDLLVNCIQFFRQNIRFSLSEMANKTFLEGLYRKACGIYCPTNMEAIDLIVPCYAAPKDGLPEDYLPIVISIKNLDTCLPKKQLDSFMIPGQN